MHGMNVRVKIQPGKIEEAAKLLREEVMPTAANYQGFVQNFLIVDAPNSRIASLSVWESEIDAKAIYEEEGGLYQSFIAGVYNVAGVITVIWPVLWSRVAG